MTELKPTEVFKFFSEINKVPRPSGKPAKIIDYLKQFAESRGLEHEIDQAGNVIIRKPAAPGMENRQGVILQSHTDMVCEKVKNLEFDFNNETIQAYIDGQWMKAKGTTLGADDGIGMALSLAALDSQDIKHGPLECLFTCDEETGLDGAFAIQPDFMKGKYLINLDSEDEGEIYIGCAGGQNTTAQFTYATEEIPADYFTIRINIDGLCGGHSGDDIVKKRANANKLMARFLYSSMKKYDLRIIELTGGNLHNAIPRYATTLVALPSVDKEDLRVDFNVFASEIEDEFHTTEKTLKFTMQSEPSDIPAIEQTTARRIIMALHAVHNGVYEMSQDIDGIPETSSNIASIRMNDGTLTVISSQRSMTLSSRLCEQEAIEAAFLLAGARVTTNGGYPGWKPNLDSQLLQTAISSYKNLYAKEPKVKVIHAGLECGLFTEKYPHLELISIGPTMRDVHSPDERLYIPSVQLVWNLIAEILKNL
jgi:dipeptidase D